MAGYRPRSRPRCTSPGGELRRSGAADREDLLTARLRLCSEPSVAEAQDDPAARGQGGVSADVALPILPAAVVRGAVHLYGDLEIGQSRVEVHGAEGQRDRMLLHEPR